jgi:hypothetical protein
VDGDTKRELATANWQESYGEGVIMYFYDISKITYARLVDTTKYQKPYRGSNNAYPLGDRRYSARHFRAMDDGTFDIWYMHRGCLDDVISGKEISEYYKSCKPLAKLYPDNTLEFTETRGYHQGERAMLSELIGYGTMYQVKSKGGTIWTCIDGTYPVFQGLRISLDTYKPVTEFTVVQPVLNRKKSNAIMKSYKEFLDVFPVYIKAMDSRAAIEVIKDLHDQSDKFNGAKFNNQTLKETADKKHYVDAAFINYLLQYHWIRNNFKYQLGENGSGEARMPRDWQEDIMKTVERHFRKAVLGEIDEAFDWVTLPKGKLCASPWDHKIVSPTGEEFKQM